MIGQNEYHDNIIPARIKIKLSVWKVVSHFDSSKSKDGAQRGFSPGIPVSSLLKKQPMV